MKNWSSVYSVRMGLHAAAGLAVFGSLGALGVMSAMPAGIAEIGGVGLRFQLVAGALLGIAAAEALQVGFRQKRDWAWPATVAYCFWMICTLSPLSIALAAFLLWHLLKPEMRVPALRDLAARFAEPKDVDAP